MYRVFLLMELLQIIIVWYPCGNDTTSFRLIISQHCCFMTVGMMYAPRVATGRSYVDNVLILIIPIAAKPSNNTLERCVRVKGQVLIIPIAAEPSNKLYRVLIHIIPIAVKPSNNTLEASTFTPERVNILVFLLVTCFILATSRIHACAFGFLPTDNHYSAFNRDS
ncbi:hypothetical protein V8E54_005737 [Elaphomyces granulatus]